MLITGGIVVLMGLVGGWFLYFPEDSGSPDMAWVKGKISFAGKPLEKGLVQFKTDTGSPASIEVVGGMYRGKAIIGFSRVMITAPEVVGKQKAYPTENSPTTDVTEERIPARYNLMSGLQRDVKPGNNEFDFELEAEPN
jgi:hypothetical protein